MALLSIALGDIRERTKRVMENGKAILAAAGRAMSNVVETTISLTHIGDFASVNKIYGSCFPADPPARATAEVSRLQKDVSVEIDLVENKE